jgi:hypothetical protein
MRREPFGALNEVRREQLGHAAIPVIRAQRRQPQPGGNHEVCPNQFEIWSNEP